ncbi:MAG: hypothetical protein H0T73_04250 [Ardenticatenales bacterium]|nr:hypothetical protein [Ardenticatenales bacterium]
MNSRYLFIALGYALVTLILWRLHHYSVQDFRPPGAGPDIQAQLNWTGRALREGAGEATQSWYPEGYFFAHAIYGSALVNQALLQRDDPALLQRNVVELEWVLQRLESDAGRAPFARQQAVEYGVFYQGWLNRLVGGLLLLQPEGERSAEREAQFHRQTEALAQAFLASPSLHLEAYPGSSWPVDNVVALSSLRLHDELYGTDYQSVIDQWLAYARSHLDPETGLLPHAIDARTGQIRQGARGSSLVLALIYLPELDPTFAEEQYSRFRTLYAQPVMDFILFREYPHGVNGPSDVDSGPLLGGISPVASGVSLAAARANGDEESFERLVQLSEVVGMPITLGGEKRFIFGQLAVGDAFLAWGKTLVPWRATPTSYPVNDYPRLTSPWYLWTNGIALILMVGLGALLFRARR